MNTFKKSVLRFALTGLAFAGMAFTLPSCPGQQALQEQVDTMSTSVQKQTKAVNDLSAQVRTMNDEMNTMKSLLSQVSSTVLAQKTTIEELQAKTVSLDQRLSAASKYPARSSTPARRGTVSPRRHR